MKLEKEVITKLKIDKNFPIPPICKTKLQFVGLLELIKVGDSVLFQEPCSRRIAYNFAKAFFEANQ